MQARSSLHRHSNSESSDRVVVNLKPRSWGDETHEQPQTVQPQNTGFDLRNVDWFSHDPGPRSPVRVFNSIQAKLTVGAPNDQYEQEADRVADQVMNTPDSAVKQPIQREAMPEEEEEIQTKPLAATITPLVQREALPEEEEELQTKSLGNSIQREALPEEEEEIQAKSLGSSIQREALPEEEEEEVQTKALGGSIQREAMPEEEEEIQTKRSPDAGFQAGNNLESRLISSQGGGTPLAEDVRAFMEPRFGADFSQVRVHTGSESVQMNQDLNAQAFTHKQDVYFGAGKAPGKDALTAHELTHTIQQSPGTNKDAKRLERSNKPEPIHTIQKAPPKGSPGDDSLEYGAKALDLGLLDSDAKKLVKGAAKLNTIAQNLRKKGTSSIWSNDEKMLKNAQQLTDLAKALSNVATGLTSIVNSSAGQTFKKGDEIFDKASKLVNIANAIGSAIEAENALDDLQAHPNDYNKATSWARSVGNVFDSSSKLIELIPDGALPGFVLAYWKGLLSAPKNYIEAFITIMEIRYKKLDAEAGISGDTRKATQGDNIMWKGDLTTIYMNAFFVEPMGKLDQFMKVHQETEGVDLFKTTVPVGKNLLINALEREIPFNPDPQAQQDPRRAWIPWLRSQS